MAKQESSIYLSRTLVSGHDKGITILPCNYFDIRVFISFSGYTQHTRCILENYYTRKWRSGYGKRNKRLFERTFRNSEFRRERWIEDEEMVYAYSGYFFYFGNSFRFPGQRGLSKRRVESWCWPLKNEQDP